MPDIPPGWLHAGMVGRPHGLDGSFHVVAANPLLLVFDAAIRISTSGEERRITRRAGTDARPILRLEGYEDRSAAATLSGAALLVARSAAPELEADEWWAEDLEGCAVNDGARRVGVVRRLLALPSCEVLEVERAPGAGDLLVPLVADAVRSVDLERREIDVDLAFLGEDG
jgi:16S rRNA processing protein RimM